jgi:hypothetical protein
MFRQSEKEAKRANRPARIKQWRDFVLQVCVLAVLLFLAYRLIPGKAGHAAMAGIMLAWFFAIGSWSYREKPPVERSLVRKLLFGLEREENVSHQFMALIVIVVMLFVYFA